MPSFSTFLSSQKNRQFLFFILGAIMLYYYSKNKAKAAELAKFDGGFQTLRVIPSIEVPLPGTVDPAPEPPTVPIGDPPSPDAPPISGDPLGVWKIDLADVDIYRNRSDKFDLSFNNSQQITDSSAGLSWDGTYTITADGKRRFYLIDDTNSFFQDAAGNNLQLLNIKLERGPHSVQAWDINPTMDFATFKNRVSNPWPNPIDNTNCKIYHLDFTMHSAEASYSAVPSWLVASGKLELPLTGGAASMGDKLVGVAWINAGDTAAMYQNKDLIVSFNSTPSGGNKTKRTMQAHGVADDQFFNFGYGAVSQMGVGNKIMLTTQFGEDGRPGLDGPFERGARDKYKDSGVTDIRQMGIFGEYGNDEDIASLAGVSTQADFEASLTTKLFYRYGPGGVAWSDNLLKNYLAAGKIDRRNANHKDYFECGPQNVFWKALYINEVFTLMCAKYDGQNRPRRMIAFTQPWYEDVKNRIFNNNYIKFPEGELRAHNDYTPVGMPLMFRYCLANTLVCDGVDVWDAPAVDLGSDPTKAYIYDHNVVDVKWRKTGDANFSAYVPGVNGAPLRSTAGIHTVMPALAANAAFAGFQAARDILAGTANNIKFVNYNSTLGNITLTGGTTGLNLNGHGPLNENNFCLWTLRNRGIALNVDDKVLVYCNENIPPHRYEDVVCMGKSFKAYGGQFYKISLL